MCGKYRIGNSRRTARFSHTKGQGAHCALFFTYVSSKKILTGRYLFSCKRAEGRGENTPLSFSHVQRAGGAQRFFRTCTRATPTQIFTQLQKITTVLYRTKRSLYRICYSSILPYSGKSPSLMVSLRLEATGAASLTGRSLNVRSGTPEGLLKPPPWRGPRSPFLA